MGWSKTCGVLCFIHIVVQGYTEKPRLHFITLAPHEMGTTGTLPIIHGTPGEYDEKTKLWWDHPSTPSAGVGLAEKGRRTPCASKDVPQQSQKLKSSQEYISHPVMFWLACNIWSALAIVSWRNQDNYSSLGQNYLDQSKLMSWHPQILEHWRTKWCIPQHFLPSLLTAKRDNIILCLPLSPGIQFWTTHLQKNIAEVEKTQRWVTKIIIGLSIWSFSV